MEMEHPQLVCGECGRKQAAERLAWLGRPSRPDATTSKRGWTAEGPRDRRMTVRFTEEERAELEDFADLVGTQPGSWVAQVAVAYARGLLRPVPQDWQDVLGQLMSYRTQLVRAFTLLNQLTQHANATGRLAAEHEETLATCSRILGQLDAVTAAASERLGRDR